jgi:hypothetical protein
LSSCATAKALSFRSLAAMGSDGLLQRRDAAPGTRRRSAACWRGSRPNELFDCIAKGLIKPEVKVPYEVNGRQFEEMIVYDDGDTKTTRASVFMQPD